MCPGDADPLECIVDIAKLSNMSLRAFTAPTLDGRAYGEEDGTLGRVASNSSAPRPSTMETRLDGTAQFVEPSPAASPAPERRRVLFPDPVAFRFLEEDPCVSVVERRKELKGYELYLVEQWACSRESPTLVITAYTGDPKHSVIVGVLAIPAEEKDWSARLRLYFKAIQQYHARPKETDLGELMVTNLSSFPSALTVIPVPDGDIRKHRQVFIVNENLKRMGCSGRSGMTLSDPTPATQAKFLQLYKTSDRIPFFQAVLELVKLCQIALFIFGKLEQEYIDGLLCDKTETGINNWWTEIGSEYYNMEPTDGILGPTTVAALLGTLMGARNRLSYYGAPVTKDVFDIDNTKRGLGTFQKSYKLEKTRRLDRQTLLKLHNVTAKAAAGEGGWGVQKAVKSTVAEIGGKRGELMIGIVGGREKGNIGDIETLDLEKFITLVHGDRAKWLWHGKPRKSGQEHHDNAIPDMGTLLFKKDTREETSTQAQNRRAQTLPTEDEIDAKKKEESPSGIYSAPPPGSATSIVDSSPGDNVILRKGLMKSMAGKMSDARSGLGRIKDAVGGGLKGHTSRPSRDDPGTSGAPSGLSTPSIATLAQPSATLSSPVMVGRAFTWKNKPEEYQNAFRKEVREPGGLMQVKTFPGSGTPAPVAKNDFRSSEEPQKQPPQEELKNSVDSQRVQNSRDLVNESSVPGSVLDDSELQGLNLGGGRTLRAPLLSLQRRHSVASLRPSLEIALNDVRYARRLSFADAEDAVLRWCEIADATDADDADRPNPSNAELARHLYSFLERMQQSLIPWVGTKLAGIEALDDSFGQQQADLQALYWTMAEAQSRIRHGSAELLGEQRGALAEAVKDVETLVAKLEYEISALVGRVQDLEDGVAQFEAQVDDVERRAEELKVVLETESWLHWFVRTLTGIGTGPNITRPQNKRVQV